MNTVILHTGRQWRLLMSFVILTTALAAAQDSKANTHPQADRDLEALVAGVEQLPVEYRTDLLLALVQSGKVKSRQLRLEWLEWIFRDADAAAHPLKRTYVGDERTLDSSLDFSQNLDRLSIRMRVVDALLGLDRKRALGLMESIRVEAPESPCESSTVPDLVGFYAALGGALKRGYLPARRQDYLRVLQARIEEVDSAAQLAPATDLLVQADVDKQGLERATFSLLLAMGKLRASDRELDAIFRFQGMDAKVRALTRKLKSEGLAAFGLLQAYREFLTRSAVGPACADKSADRKLMAEQFNALLPEHELTGSVEALTAEDLEPHKQGAPSRATPIPEAPEFRGSFTPLIALSAASQRRRSDVDRLSWESFSGDLLNRIAAIDVAHASCHACMFEKKTSLLLVLVHLSPDGKARQRVIDYFLQFLATDSLQTEDPMRWIPPVKVILNFARKPSPQQLERISQLQRQGKILTMLPSDYGIEIRRSIATSGNLILLQYAKAEGVLNPPYELPPF